jgi:hypothetical protein
VTLDETGGAVSDFGLHAARIAMPAKGAILMIRRRKLNMVMVNPFCGGAGNSLWVHYKTGRR